jgi:hypothetical protein
MNRTAVTSAFAAGCLIILAGLPQCAEAHSPMNRSLVLASSDKAAATASSHRRHVPYRRWRHRGGRHPFYGSGH